MAPNDPALCVNQFIKDVADGMSISQENVETVMFSRWVELLLVSYKVDKENNLLELDFTKAISAKVCLFMCFDSTSYEIPQS